MQWTKMYRKLKQMSTNKYFCSSGGVLYFAFRPCLLIILLAVLQQVVGISGFGTSCPRFVGKYRDCTCGVEYRDIEERCCNSFTCYEPVLRSENFSCTFECQNGGTRNTRGGRPCFCQKGYHGICCQKGNVVFELLPVQLLQTCSYIHIDHGTAELFNLCTILLHSIPCVLLGIISWSNSRLQIQHPN